MRRIVPVSSITEINMGETEDGMYQIVFLWGDGEGKIYFMESEEVLNTFFSECVEPYLGDPRVYAWSFDDNDNLPSIIIK